MSNQSDYNYNNIEEPYDNLVERNDTIPVSNETSTDLNGSSSQPSSLGEDDSSTISGKQLNDLWIQSWIKSTNYQPKKQGFYLDGKTGYIEATKLYIGDGGIIGGKLDIPDTTTDNSFHVDTSGNTWWGANVADGYASADAYTLNTGAAVFNSVTIAGRSGTALATAINASANLVTDIINSKLDSSSKQILSDFDFGTTDYAGAVKSGDITWNTTTGVITGGSGVVVYRDGIIGASGGTTTFSLDATTGDAYFKGDIFGSTITGGVLQSSTSNERVEITGNDIYLYDNSVGGTDPITGNSSTAYFKRTDLAGGIFIIRKRKSIHDDDDDVAELSFTGNSSGGDTYLFLGLRGTDTSYSATRTHITRIHSKYLTQLGTDACYYGKAATTEFNIATSKASDEPTWNTGGSRVFIGAIDTTTTAAYNPVTGAGGSATVLGIQSSSTYYASLWIDMYNTYIASDLMPYADSSYNLGSTSVRYSNVWTDNLNGVTPGNFIPSGGSTNQYLKYNGAGDAQWSLLSGTGAIGGTLTPSSDEVYNLGSSSAAFLGFYARNIYFQGGNYSPSIDGQICYYNNGGTYQMRVNLNGTVYSFDLTAV